MNNTSHNPEPRDVLSDEIDFGADHIVGQEDTFAPTRKKAKEILEKPRMKDKEEIFTPEQMKIFNGAVGALRRLAAVKTSTIEDARKVQDSFYQTIGHPFEWIVVEMKEQGDDHLELARTGKLELAIHKGAKWCATFDAQKLQIQIEDLSDLGAN